MAIDLADYATQTNDGRWYFGSFCQYAHGEAAATAIVEACLLLDVPVTDVVTAPAWLKLIDRVVTLSERVERLEQNR
jgi:hypothetical protein